MQASWQTTEAMMADVLALRRRVQQAPRDAGGASALSVQHLSTACS